MRFLVLAVGRLRPPYQDDIAHYQKLLAGHAKVEVVEVFNFVCPACFSFQPGLSDWEKRKPAHVRFTYVPAAFGPKWDQYVRAFYTAQTMGIEEKTHAGIYNAIHLENRLQGERGDDSDAAIAKVYAALGGVDAAQFAANMKSFAVMAKFNKAAQYIRQQQVDGTPTLILNRSASSRVSRLAEASPRCVLLSKPTAWAGVVMVTHGHRFEHQGHDLWDLGVLAKELLT